MKEQTMKETTLKVKNQTTTLQKAIILGDIGPMSRFSTS